MCHDVFHEIGNLREDTNRDCTRETVSPPTTVGLVFLSFPRQLTLQGFSLKMPSEPRVSPLHPNLGELLPWNFGACGDGVFEATLLIMQGGKVRMRGVKWHLDGFLIS